MKLEEVCDIFSGYALKSFNSEGKGLPVIKIGNINANGTVELTDCTYSEEQVNEKFISKKNDIYVALSGATTGKVGLMLENGYLINQRVGVVRLKNNDIPISYLLYYLQSKTEKILSDASGAAQPNISPKQISDYTFAYENVEQIQIVVNKIKLVDRLYFLKMQQLQKLDEIVKSQFVQIFGDLKRNEKHWNEFKKLEEVCVLNPKKNELQDNGNITVTFVPMQSVSENGKIDVSEKRKLNDVKSGFTYFKENDVLFAKITPCMENGKGAVARGLENNIGFGSTEFHVIRPKEKINSTWVYTLFSMPYFRLEAEKNMTGSAGQKRVPIKFIGDYKIGIPPIELQNQFENFVEHINKQKFTIEKSLEKLEILKKSLMQKYFE